MLELDAFDSRSLFDSVPALRAEKSSLKKQLKAFDTAFQKEHGKMVWMACGCGLWVG